MRREDFERLTESVFGDVQRLNRTKGHDYAGDDDALANFKQHAEQLGLTPYQIWAVYAGKHWDAIMTFCREVGAGGYEASEPIDGRVLDLALYMLLLLGLLSDLGDSPRGEG